jgi:hypothetical protein
MMKFLESWIGIVAIVSVLGLGIFVVSSFVPYLLTSLAVLASSIAVIVASLTLWYGLLRGPHIILFEQPTFKTQSLGPPRSEKPFIVIPYTADFDSTFILLNDGSRGGVIRFEIKFQPISEFKPFYVNSQFSLSLVRSDLQIRALPTDRYYPINDHESATLIPTIHIQFRDWREQLDYDSDCLINDEKQAQEYIYRTLCKANSKNFQMFKAFCMCLGIDSDAKDSPQVQKKLGDLECSSFVTTREGLASTRIVPTNITNLPEKVPLYSDDMFTKAFADWLSKWVSGQIEENPVKISLEEIARSLDEPISILNDLLISLEQTDVEKISLIDVSLKRILDWKVDQIPLTFRIKAFILEYKRLRSRLEEIRMKGSSAENLSKDINEAIRDLHSVGEILAKCIDNQCSEM